MPSLARTMLNYCISFLHQSVLTTLEFHYCPITAWMSGGSCHLRVSKQLALYPELPVVKLAGLVETLICRSDLGVPVPLALYQELPAVKLTGLVERLVCRSVLGVPVQRILYPKLSGAKLTGLVERLVCRSVLGVPVQLILYPKLPVVRLTIGITLCSDLDVLLH